MRRPSRTLSLIASAALGAGGLVVATNAGTAVADSPVVPTRAAPSQALTADPVSLRTGKKGKKRDVMFIGNNHEGTATIVDARSYKTLGTINLVPDLQEEIQAIFADPVHLAFYLAIKTVISPGNDQLVDDLFTTRDGNLIAVSRPSLADVVWVDLKTGKIVAEQQMDGYRTDHMEVSPDGKRLLVSDSTSKQVIEYVMGGRGKPNTGKRLRTFPSGETPHESNFIKNGKKIVHASIGRVYTPLDAGELGPIGDVIKADRWFQIVRNSDFKILQRWDMGKELAEAGFPNMSSAVRPMALSPDEKTAYLQVSFFHGFVEFDLTAPDLNGTVDYTSGGLPEPRKGAVKRLVDLPISDSVKAMPREAYVLDSAHHGLAINKRGTKLCVAGTMSDYAAIVRIKSEKHKIFNAGEKPYWSTTSPFSNTCWMSMSGTDQVVVLDYAKEKVVKVIDVGDHPQRVREGHLSKRVNKALRAQR